MGKVLYENWKRSWLYYVSEYSDSLVDFNVILNILPIN